jgi:hypothetical protein
MHHAGQHVARLAVLAQPDLDHVIDALGNTVESAVRCRLDQRRHTDGHDIGKDGDAQQGIRIEKTTVGIKRKKYLAGAINAFSIFYPCSPFGFVLRWNKNE